MTVYYTYTANGEIIKNLTNTANCNIIENFFNSSVISMNFSTIGVFGKSSYDDRINSYKNLIELMFLDVINNDIKLHNIYNTSQYDLTNIKPLKIQFDEQIIEFEKTLTNKLNFSQNKADEIIENFK